MSANRRSESGLQNFPEAEAWIKMGIIIFPSVGLRQGLMKKVSNLAGGYSSIRAKFLSSGLLKCKKLSSNSRDDGGRPSERGFTSSQSAVLSCCLVSSSIRDRAEWMQVCTVDLWPLIVGWP